MSLPHTVCVFLGPYRNLTTLTAAILHLHPHCQALNHAGGRVLGVRQLDFLVDHSAACFERFCEFALSASQGGRRGNYGGSILLSHAFADHATMREAFRDRYGETLVKTAVESIVWKESLFVGKHLRERSVDIEALLEANPRLRFVMPVRNPLDCAASNMRTGHAKHLPGKGADMRATVADILAELAWFWDLRRRYGKRRFAAFFEYEVDATLPARLGALLELSPDARWLDDATRCLDLSPGPEHEPELRAWYRRYVGETVGADRELADSLQRVVEYRRAQVR